MLSCSELILTAPPQSSLPIFISNCILLTRTRRTCVRIISEHLTGLTSQFWVWRWTWHTVRRKYRLYHCGSGFWHQTGVEYSFPTCQTSHPRLTKLHCLYTPLRFLLIVIKNNTNSAARQCIQDGDEIVVYNPQYPHRADVFHHQHTDHDIQRTNELSSRLEIT